jgi:hypothetical protein
MISAYFDESAEENSQHGILTVSGYALDEAGSAGLIPEWKSMLGKYSLPYFHMAECNSDLKKKNNVFSHLSKTECDKCAREAITIARTYPLHGWAVILDQSEYRRILEAGGFNCDPYTFMVYTLAIHVEKWTRLNRPEDISLFFEAGYRTEHRARDLLKTIKEDERFARMVSATFVAKEKSEPTQAADLIAWHIRKGYENTAKGKPVRKDTQALISDRIIYTIEYTTGFLENMRDDFLRNAGSLAEASRIMFSSRDLERAVLT